MKDLIRKRLDQFEGRHDRDDEELAAMVNKGLDAMADRRVHRIFLAIMAATNAAIWLSVILFPRDVREAWSRVTDVSDKIGLGVVAIVFGIGMWLTYSIIRLRIPDVEEQRLDAEVFGSLGYQARSSRRFLVWLFAVAAGVINLLAIVIVVIALSTN